MAPRQKDKKMVVTSNRITTAAISPASRPTLFELPKDITFMDIHHHSPLPNSDSTHPEEAVLQRMSDSLDRASQRATELQKRIDVIKIQFPLMHEACCTALVDEMSKVLMQASLLLEDARKEEHDVSWATKKHRLSMALVGAIQYLDTLEAAMAFSSRDRLEEGLLSVLHSIVVNSKDELQHAADSLNLCVSSWRVPSLAFDFHVGKPAKLSLPAKHQDSLPIELEVTPIIEFTADDLLRPSGREAEAYAVRVVSCSHEKREHGTRDGITGEALVQVHIEPLTESKTKKQAVWGIHKDVDPVCVAEVRATQQNAYPTKFRINFDMYTSTVYGQSGVTLTLALETCQTMDGTVPKVKIDLVVEP